jgi:hypothetical protein
MVEAVEIEFWHAGDSIPEHGPLVASSRVQLDHVAFGDRMGPADATARGPCYSALVMA